MREMLVGAMAMCLVARAAGAAERGLVAHWPLDEGAGNVAKDATGNGNDGEVHGARWVKYGDGRVLAFDGVDDRVECGSPEALDVRGPTTLSLWVWPAEVPSTEVGIAGKQFSSYLITFYSTRQAYWYVGSGGNGINAGLATGKWSHIAGVFDGKTIAIHVNGRLVGRRVSKFNAVPSGKDFRIGCVAGDPSADDSAYIQGGFFPGRIADVKVHARSLNDGEIRTQFESGIKGRFAPVPLDCRPIEREAGKTVVSDTMAVRYGRKGGLEIRTRSSFCIVESTYSYPAGGRIGFNALSERSDHLGEAGWNPETVPDAHGMVLSASGAFYSLRRTVRVRHGQVDIADKPTNLTDQPVGILIKHRVITPKTLTNTRVGVGAPDPIVYGAGDEFDLGIAAEDFISRTNFAPFVTANQAGYEIAHFALDGGKSHTVKWSVHTLEPTGNQFALINRVREQWGVNHTVPGPCAGIDVLDKRLEDPTALKAWLKRRKLGVAMMAPWLDYEPGTMDHVVTRAEYKALMAKAIKALKTAEPNIKVLGCIETDWITLYPEKINGGEKLPAHTGVYTGHAWLTDEQAKVISESDLPWKDSVILSKSGQVRVELYRRGDKPQIALNVIPGPGNYQSKFLMEQVRYMVEEVGLDGFYIDEFNPFWYRSYHAWDGYTVDIDPATGEIIAQYCHPSIYGRQTRLKLCQYAKDHGLVMIANTYAATTEESRLPTIRFAETFSTFATDVIAQSGKPEFLHVVASAQLGSPVGLGLRANHYKDREAQLLVRGLIAYLRHGVLHYYYSDPALPKTGPGSGEYGPTNHMFPMTPVRLFEGGIVGKERTITCVSGKYEWVGPKEPTVLTFDKVGREKPSDVRIEETGDGWSVRVKLDDWNEIAVIE